MSTISPRPTNRTTKPSATPAIISKPSQSATPPGVDLPKVVGKPMNDGLNMAVEPILGDNKSIDEVPVAPVEITAQQIRVRAYYMYLSRGGENGCAEQDWIAAEAQLRAEALERAH